MLLFFGWFLGMLSSPRRRCTCGDMKVLASVFSAMLVRRTEIIFSSVATSLARRIWRNVMADCMILLAVGACVAHMKGKKPPFYPLQTSFWGNRILSLEAPK
jgi:hypothetical protein